MRLGVLFSGGKDSCLSMDKVCKDHKVACLLTIISENPESYMFHVPNIELTSLQAESMNLPILTKITKGEKEKELEDLIKLIFEAKTKYKIQGIVTGAVESVYQASRIQKICDDLNLWCFNPLWQKNQVELLNELLDNNFEVMITGVFGYPLDESWLGRVIDNQVINELKKLQEKYGLNPAGEGGEIETTVLNSPMFKKRLVIRNYEKEYANYAGIFNIKEVKLE
jgi:ABC transporter with metal-binding/Fe-S-binding domain ATP-binding protein